jgi:hypothetical protein
MYRGTRTDPDTYTHWSLDGFIELYHQARDPNELTNLAYHPRYAAVQDALEQRTQALAQCSGDSCRTGFADLPRPLTPRSTVCR